MQPLLVDIGNVETDNMLAGYFNIITGYRERVMYKVSL
jgi:hypothetical protein